MDDPGQLRISDADRHRVAEVLREAAGEGRLDLAELDERLEAAYAAKVYADLAPLVVDLPGGRLDLAHGSLPVRPSANALGLPPGPRHETSVGILGGQDRKGVWTVAETHTAVAVMGGVKLDLRQALFPQRETVIRAYAVWGGIEVVVNESTHVVVDGAGIMGAFEQARDKVEPQVGPDSPVVRVTGLALMGGVTVQRRRLPGTDGGRRALDR